MSFLYLATTCNGGHFPLRWSNVVETLFVSKDCVGSGTIHYAGVYVIQMEGIRLSDGHVSFKFWFIKQQVLLKTVIALQESAMSLMRRCLAFLVQFNQMVGDLTLLFGVSFCSTVETYECGGGVGSVMCDS